MKWRRKSWRDTARLLKNEGFFKAEKTMRKIKTLALLLLGAVMMAACGDNQPQEKKRPDVYYTQNGKKITITPIKHASLQINYDGREFEIDPVCSHVGPVLSYLDKPKADFILVTNKQLDHFDDYAIHVLTDKYTELIIPKDIWYQMRIGNVMENNMYMNIGQKSVIYCVPAYNISKKNAKRHPKGRWNGYVLDFDGFRIYIAGDTEYIPEMKDLKNISIAFLPVSRFTMDLKQLRKAVETIKPKVVYPYHFYNADTAQIRHALQGTGAEVRIRYLR
jgi:L-ascorbate metabolism protein UlaG (beta-lactamase superfamily)